jgi:hypothetical protein
MALRLNQVVLAGEVINTEHYSTRGWLELRGLDGGMHLSLTGNCGAGLSGCHIRFRMKLDLQDPGGGDPDDGTIRNAADIDWLARRQIGPTGDMRLGETKLFAGSVEELYLRNRAGEPPPPVVRPCLYLEWYSQNGRVVLELADPEIEYVTRGVLLAPLPDAHLAADPSMHSLFEWQPADVEASDDEPPPTGLGITKIELDDDGCPSIDHEFYSDSAANDAAKSPWNELQRELDRQADELDRIIRYGEDGDDPEIRELYLMDELIERRTGTVLSELIEGPLRLPLPAAVMDDAAEGPLKSLLAQLALFGIQISVCPHNTPKAVYRWLLEEIIPHEIGHVELKRTQWVSVFDTSESCPACEAEFEREYQERKKIAPQRNADDPPDDEIPF